MRAELVELSAGELAAAMRRRDASPVEVVDAHLARIETCNPDLNALVALRQVGARQEAKAAEAALLRGDQLGPLHGIPFTVKDIIATAELPTTCGSGALAGYRPRADATAVARMRAAGGILLGKSNCPEFALGIFSSSPLFGRPQSPLGEITPGGSSAGESAAIAAGLSPLGLGTDFGGSLRWPAHCTGIASIRPTVGRVPGTGQVPGPAGHDSGPPNAVSLQGRLQVIGPLARTAADLDLALSVLVGPDGIDPAAVPVPLPRAADTDALALAYAWCDGDGSTPLRPDVVALVEQAATCLERLGATVVRHRPMALTAPRLCTHGSARWMGSTTCDARSRDRSTCSARN
jgi:amidase